MRAFGLFFIVFFISMQTKGQEFKFEKESIDYGKIQKGSNGERTFVFTNSGDAPLIITNIKSSCGCTVPKKPEKPIMPGKKEKLRCLMTPIELVAFLNLSVFFLMLKLHENNPN